MRLTRRHTLGLLSAAVVAPMSARASAEYSLKPVEVADQIWIIEGGIESYSTENGGAVVNSALLGTDAGMVIVDTGPSEHYGRVLRKLAGEINPLGAAAVINTHHHAGHCLGNRAFADLPVYALGETIDRGKSTGEAELEEMKEAIGPWCEGTRYFVPNEMVPDGLLEIGGRRLEVLNLKGHCEADLALIDGSTGTLIAGDLVFNDRAPIAQSVDFEAWFGALDVLEHTGFSGILAGHGPFDPAGESLAETRRYLKWLETRLNSAVALGLDVETAAGIGQPDDIAALGAMPDEYYRAVEVNLPKLAQVHGIGKN